MKLRTGKEVSITRSQEILRKLYLRHSSGKVAAFLYVYDSAPTAIKKEVEIMTSNAHLHGFLIFDETMVPTEENPSPSSPPRATCSTQVGVNLNGDLDDELEEEYEVENILDFEVNIHRQILYLIKWWGYDQAENTLEPMKSLLPNAKQMLDDFNQRHQLQFLNGHTPELLQISKARRNKSTRQLEYLLHFKDLPFTKATWTPSHLMLPGDDDIITHFKRCRQTTKQGMSKAQIESVRQTINIVATGRYRQEPPAPKSQKCKFCGLEIVSKRQLRNHLKQTHPK